MLKNCESEIEVLQYLNLGIVLRFKDVPKSAVAHRPDKLFADLLTINFVATVVRVTSCWLLCPVNDL